jgi:hypothetical protein
MFRLQHAEPWILLCTKFLDPVRELKPALKGRYESYPTLKLPYRIYEFVLLDPSCMGLLVEQF